MNSVSRKKRWNYNLVEYQKRHGHSIVFGHPYWLTIDPSSVCPLRCVFCPTGQRRGTRPQVLMTFDRCKAILDALGPYLFHVDFCNWGEPFMNADLPRMIAYAKQFGPTVKVDTSLNMPLDDDAMDAIMRSGLDRLTMSVDGVRQETYETYRRGGNLDLALGNMRRLVAAKKRRGAATPHLHWQFLVFRHNEHEIDEARSLAADIGVDSIGFTGPFCSPDWVPTKEEYNNYIVKDAQVAFKRPQAHCTWLWDALTVNADGAVSPCCSVEDGQDDFGNFFLQPLFMLWNNARFRAARRHVVKRAAPAAGNVCTRCDHIGASNHAAIPDPTTGCR